MIKVYPTKMKAMVSMHKEFETEEQARAYVSSRKNPDNYTIEVEGLKIKPTATKSKKVEKTTKKVKKASGGQKTHVKTSESTKASWKTETDFSSAVQITRENVKNFYKKEGYIQVTDPTGKVLHVGRTKNMGKVFSNYVNCARYNQSYEFNLEGGDILLFKEDTITA